MENIEEFYKTKMKEIDNFQLMTFKTFEEYEDHLLIELLQLQKTITRQVKLLQDNIQSEETIADLLSNAMNLGEETTIDYVIIRSIYKQLFKELKNLSPKTISISAHSINCQKHFITFLKPRNK